MNAIIAEQVCRNVDIEIQFLHIGEIDNLNEKYSAEIKIVAKWVETENLNMNTYDPELDWNPRLYIQNLLSDELKESTKYRVERMEDFVRITETKIVKGQFWERIELYDVPFDLQQLNIVVKTKLSPEEISLSADIDKYILIHPETKRTFIGQQKWKLFNISRMSYNLDKSQTRDPQSIWSTGSKIKVQTSSEEVQALIRYSRISERRPLKVVGTCFAARRSEFYISNAFFLIFLFTLSALTVFSIPENMPQARLPTTYTIMLSSISFKWVFNRSLPAVPYLTVLDKYSISGILFINLLAAWHALVGKYNKQWDPQVDKYVMFGFLALFLIEHLFFLIVYFIITRKKRFLQHEEYKFIRKFLKENRLTSLKQIEEEDIY